MIKNYTSSVPANITIARIESTLARCGACGVSKEFSPTGQVASLRFYIQAGDRKMSFRLPADPEAVKRTMLKAVKKMHRGTAQRIEEQAQRTSWKLMQDWTEVQVSLIELQKVDTLQVFLPYLFDERKGLTYYEAIKEAGFKMLPEKTE